MNGTNEAKMNSDLKEAFSQIKPVCDVLMVCPSLESLSAYTARVSELKKEIVQELQQYLLYPLISRIKCSDIKRRVELHLKILDAVRTVLEKITVNSFEMYMRLETGLLSIIFDANKPGMISDATEEVKYNTVRCLTVLMLNIPHEFRVKLLNNQVPMLAQAVFVSVHIAKLERLRVLRIAAINCVTAHTMTHPSLTAQYRMRDAQLELLAIDSMLCSILPGVLAALQDVCACTDNPTHAVITAAIEAIHRIMCIPMHDKYLPRKTISANDFVHLLKTKKTKANTEVSSKAQKSPKDMPKRSEEWFAFAGEKLSLITKSLVTLATYDHYRVRKELAVFCYRILTECSSTMSSSIPYCMDVLIALSMDEHPEVSQYCTAGMASYLASCDKGDRLNTMDVMCQNFIALLNSLPRIMNNVDSSRKLSALNRLHGYIATLSNGELLSSALSSPAAIHSLREALLTAAAHDTARASRATVTTRDVLAPPPTGSPWSVLRHLDSPECVRRLQQVCAALGAAAGAGLLLDTLLDAFRRDSSCECAYVMNWMITAPESSPVISWRVLGAYIEEDAWYLPLEVAVSDTPLTADDTLDISVYDPREWCRDTVPDLYEGTVETRSTGVSYSAPRTAADPRRCGSLAQAAHNLVLSCLLTEGVGFAAARLGDDFHPYLMRTLCMLLERMGSSYELLHSAGVKAAAAAGGGSARALIARNADYCTHQISRRLKRSWRCQSALQILSVVMEYSDVTILHCLHGIVDDILVQSCDKYYENDILAYLQAFLTFVECVHKWFPLTPRTPPETPPGDLLADVNGYIEATQEAERLLSDTEITKTAEDMYKEDQKRREEELDYYDGVGEGKRPAAVHESMTALVVTRSVNFIGSAHTHTALSAMQVISRALPLLHAHEELLPLVHRCWEPLTRRLAATEPALKLHALTLFTVVAGVAKDFVASRAVKEVLNEIYKYLHESSKLSYLKDARSHYRNSLAYKTQCVSLAALPGLAADLGLSDKSLEDAMACVDHYLSCKQPRPLQESAVKFFKKMLEYDYPASWFHLRKLCNNTIVLDPPAIRHITLEPIVGTPHLPVNKQYENNIKLIFDFMVS